MPHNGKMPRLAIPTNLTGRPADGRDRQEMPCAENFIDRGYACFNDGSVRDWQRSRAASSRSANFDGTGGFGPDIVTTDELPPGGSPCA